MYPASRQSLHHDCGNISELVYAVHSYPKSRYSIIKFKTAIMIVVVILY